MSVARALRMVLDTLPTGIRQGARWRRRNAAPVKFDGEDMSQLPTHAVLARAKGVRLHTAGKTRAGVRRGWSDRDTAVMAELEARSITWDIAQLARGLSMPMWLCRPDIHSRWLRFLLWVIYAYRQGAVGMLVSYEEAHALGFASSRTTFWRIRNELEAAGLIRVVDTWRQGDERVRDRSRNLYQVGPELVALAGGDDGLHEGLRDDDWSELTVDEKRERQQKRGDAGAQARRRARVERRAQLGVAWRKQRGEEVDPAAVGDAAEAAEPEVVYVSPQGFELYLLEGGGGDEPDGGGARPSSSSAELATTRRGGPIGPKSAPSTAFQTETPILGNPDSNYMEDVGALAGPVGPPRRVVASSAELEDGRAPPPSGDRWPPDEPLSNTLESAASAGPRESERPPESTRTAASRELLRALVEVAGRGAKWARDHLRWTKKTPGEPGAEAPTSVDETIHDRGPGPGRSGQSDHSD